MNVIHCRLKHFSTSLSVLIYRRSQHSYCSLRCVVREKENAVFPIMNVFHWQLTSRFHALSGISYAKEEGYKKTITENIHSRDVVLLDQDGNHLGVLPKGRAENLALEQDLRLGLVDNSSELPTYQLMSREHFFKLNKAAIEQAKERRKSSKSKQPKMLTMKNTIDQQSLEIKFKAIDKWIDKGKDVKIVISKPPKSGKTLVELSRKIVEHVQGRVIVSQSKTTEANMELVLKCQTDSEKCRTSVPPLFKHKDLLKRKKSVQEQNNSDLELGGKNQ